VISYQGKLAAGLAIPVLAQAVAALDIPGLEGQIAGLVKVIAQATLKPPSVAGTVIFAGKLLAQAQIAIVPPSLSIVAALDAKLALLNLKLQLVLTIKELLTSGSLRVYEFEGQAGAFGPELGATLAGADVDGGVGAAKQTFAVVLLAEGGSSGEVALKTLRGGA